MIVLTKPQRASLKRVYDRHIVEGSLPKPAPGKATGFYCPTYREFRRTVQPYIGGDCVLVKVPGMWIGIERDGHSHT
jgi:hypothetical protein